MAIQALVRISRLSESGDDEEEKRTIFCSQTALFGYDKEFKFVEWFQFIMAHLI